MLLEAPSMIVPVIAPNRDWLVLASDAQADSSPTGGFIAHFAGGDKCAAFCRFTDYILEVWRVVTNPIACCEGAMVPCTLLHLGRRAAGKRIYWLPDNTASLHAFVKGVSSNPALDRSVQLIHMLCHHLNMELWFEYVDSQSNYSDGISRDLYHDKFCAHHSIPIQEFSVDPHYWQASLLELWHIPKNGVG